MHGSAQGSLAARSGSLRLRFGPEIAWCVSLALRLGLLLVVACLAAEVLERTLGAETTALFDAPIVRYIAEHRVGWLTAAMLIVTGLGRDGSLLVVVLVAGLILRRLTGSWRPLFVLLAVAVGAAALDRVIKLVVARARPPAVWAMVPERGWAFPSGHATHSVTVYGSVAHIATRIRAASRRIHVASWVMATGMSFLVGVSRVYLGVHWPTDVIGGWILAIAWLWLALLAPPL